MYGCTFLPPPPQLTSTQRHHHHSQSFERLEQNSSVVNAAADDQQQKMQPNERDIESIEQQQQQVDESALVRLPEFHSSNANDAQYAAEPENTNRNTEWDSFDDDNENYWRQDLDEYDNFPVDLSNDIAVNQMLRDQGVVQLNPDAEVFDVESIPAYGATSFDRHTQLNGNDLNKSYKTEIISK